MNTALSISFLTTDQWTLIITDWQMSNPLTSNPRTLNECSSALVLNFDGLFAIFIEKLYIHVLLLSKVHFEVSLHPKSFPKFFEHYDRAVKTLRKFRTIYNAIELTIILEDINSVICKYYCTTFQSWGIQVIRITLN